MIDQISSLVFAVAFLLVVWRLALWDAALWRCRLTPIGVAAVPFAALSVLAVPLGPAFGFVEVNPAIFLVWIAGLASFLAASIVARNFTRMPADGSFVYLDIERLAAAVPTARIVAAIAATVAAVNLYRLLGDLAAIARLADEEFQAEFGAGIAGHVQAFAYPAVAVLVAQGRRARRIDIAFIFFGMLGALLYQVKYTVFMPVAAGVILGVQLGTIRISLRSVAIWSLGGISIFMLVYLLGFAAVNPESVGDPETYLELAKHLLLYLVSGVLAFSEALRAGAQQFLGLENAVLLPFHNLSTVIFGGSEVVGIDQLVNFTFKVSDEGTRENVFTLFGSLYLYLGLPGMMAYGFIVALITYFLLGAARRYGNPWFACAPMLMLAFFAFGWFHFFFWLLTPLEVVTASLLLAALSGLRRSRPDAAAEYVPTGLRSQQ
jgi:hypothetical protein